MATAICDGAARNSALSTRKRLINSHRASPPATERTPAIFRGRNKPAARSETTASADRDSGGLTVLTPSLVTLMATSYALIGNLRHARQQQAVDRETGGEIAQRAERIDHIADFALGDFSRRLEQILVVEKAVGFFDVVPPDLAHIHLQLDGGLAILRIVEPGNALVVGVEKTVEQVAIRRSPVAVHRHAGERHVGQIVEGEAEIGVARGLGV